jgi:hypothetical protein
MAELKVLLETKKEHTQYLQDVLVEPMMEEFEQLYQEVAMNSSQVLRDFQMKMSHIPDWNHARIEAFYANVVRKSGCRFIPDLVRSVFTTYVRIHLVSHGMGDRMSTLKLKVPTVENFLHKCMIACARQVWKQPYLFYHGVRSIERQYHRMQVEELFRKCILSTLRACVPMEQLLHMTQDVVSQSPNASASEDSSESESESESDSETESESESESNSSTDAEEEVEPIVEDPEDSENEDSEEPEEEPADPEEPEESKEEPAEPEESEEEPEEPEDKTERWKDDTDLKHGASEPFEDPEVDELRTTTLMQDLTLPEDMFDPDVKELQIVESDAESEAPEPETDPAPPTQEDVKVVPLRSMLINTKKLKPAKPMLQDAFF